MKIALAHHWLTTYRGGERVLEQIASLFPDSDVYTLIHDRNVAIPGLDSHAIHTSRLQSIPQVMKLYRHLLPIHTWAIRNLKVDPSVDVLLSSDASLIKGVDASSVSHHICYCHSPPRYLWEMADSYKQTSLAARIALDRFSPTLRQFDYTSAQRVTDFIANSNFVAQRIRKYYDRESVVIYPPVAVDEFCSTRTREVFALVVSELVSYKRIDIAVEAFNRLGKRLVIIGDGPERKRLQAMAEPNIEFLGRQPFAVLKENFERANAFIFPGIEDFGITPVEAQASGCPVIAFRAGGALETVVEGRTGLFFDDQNADALLEAYQQLEKNPLDATACEQNANTFSIERFRQSYRDHLASILGDVVPKIDVHPVEAVAD